MMKFSFLLSQRLAWYQAKADQISYGAMDRSENLGGRRCGNTVSLFFSTWVMLMFFSIGVFYEPNTEGQANRA